MAKYNAGENVIYDTYGICKIKEIKSMSFIKGEAKKDYYVLSVLNSPASTYYVPIGEIAEEKLRSPMSEGEIQKILKASADQEIGWIENRQGRKDAFLKILDEGITPKLMALIRCLYTKKLLLNENGKNLSSTDESIFSSAEKLVREEFSYSLKIGGDEVTAYIKNYFDKD